MKIVIIDNNKFYMESLFDLINKNFDFDIVGCESDAEGVEYLESASSRNVKIDLLFIDVKDDEILNSTPLLLANRYKQSINPNLKIVIFSMAEVTPLMQDAIDIGYVDYFLPKSISSAYLRLFISNIRFINYSFT